MCRKCSRRKRLEILRRDSICCRDSWPVIATPLRGSQLGVGDTVRTERLTGDGSPYRFAQQEESIEEPKRSPVAREAAGADEFADFGGEGRAVDVEIVGELLAGEGNVEGVVAGGLGLHLVKLFRREILREAINFCLMTEPKNV